MGGEAGAGMQAVQVSQSPLAGGSRGAGAGAGGRPVEPVLRQNSSPGSLKAAGKSGS